MIQYLHTFLFDLFKNIKNKRIFISSLWSSKLDKIRRNHENLQITFSLTILSYYHEAIYSVLLQNGIYSKVNSNL